MLRTQALEGPGGGSHGDRGVRGSGRSGYHMTTFDLTPSPRPPMAKRALLRTFTKIDVFDFLPTRLGEGLQSHEMPSATVKAMVWGLRAQQLPWFLRDPSNFPELPIYYKHNQKTKWALCPICHRVCVPCRLYPGAWGCIGSVAKSKIPSLPTLGKATPETK